MPPVLPNPPWDSQSGSRRGVVAPDSAGVGTDVRCVEGSSVLDVATGVHDALLVGLAVACKIEVWTYLDDPHAELVRRLFEPAQVRRGQVLVPELQAVVSYGRELRDGMSHCFLSVTENERAK